MRTSDLPNYGTAWQNQQAEFARFPGSILTTTNCVQDPRSYEKNLFTMGMVGRPGIPHLPHLGIPALTFPGNGFTNDGLAGICPALREGFRSLPLPGGVAVSNPPVACEAATFAADPGDVGLPRIPGTITLQDMKGASEMKTKSGMLVAILCLCVFSWPAMLLAQDVKAMEREINSELRNAQNLMFSGKVEEADATLNQVAERIETLKKQDPGSAQIKTLEQRFQRQRADLDRRMPAKAAKPEAPREAPRVDSTEPGRAPRPDARPVAAEKTDTRDQSKALPRNTRQAMLTLNRAIQSLETSDRDRMKKIQEGDRHFMQQMEPTLKRVQERLDELPGLFQEVLAAAEKEGAADHPEIAAAKEQIDRVTEWAGREMAASRSFVEKAEAGKAAVARDADDLRRLYDEYNEKYFNPVGNLRYAYQPDDIHKAFTLLEEYQGVRGRLEKALAEYESRYGNTREAIERATGGMANVYPWQNIREGMGTMQEVPVQLAAKIKEIIESDLGSLEKRHDFHRVSRHDELRRLAGFQKKYAPDAPSVTNLDKLLAEDLKKFEQRIDQRTWPACKGKASDRKGALAYFQETWGKDAKRNYTVLSTVVTGDWSVQKRDITGRPTMYGLPVLLAVQMPEDKAKGLARVFILTVRTPESASPKMEPPFTSDTVGDSYFIRARNVK